MKKISYPIMGDYSVPAKFLMSHVLKEEIIDPPSITSKTIEIGSSYSPEFVCTPFKYTLGTMIESINKGADTLIQLGGGCRYGYYGEVQNKILKDLGYNVDVVNLIVEGRLSIKRVLRQFKKMNIRFSKIKAIYYTFITIKMVKYMDKIDEIIRSRIGFEIVKGSYESVKEQMLLSFSSINSYYSLYKTYTKYLKKIENIKYRKPDNVIKIGIIGELYTIMEPFANYFLERQLSKNNIEIKRFTNAYYLLRKKGKMIKKYKKYVSEYTSNTMGADALDNVARAKFLALNNYSGIIHIKSSFCTPEIGIIPILNKISNDYNIPIMYFSFDANSSEVGIVTRLEAFYDMLEMRKK